MGAGQVRPTYKIPPEGFTKPLDESKRFDTNREVHFVPEWEQSGRLPDQPPDLPVNATGESGKPYKI